jgi:mRNA interferase MazF
MIVRRGEIWLADLNPIRGSEQAGTRPVLFFQNDSINRFTTTFLTIPLTTNLRRASLPSCLSISQGEGGLDSDSVAVCHQLRVLVDLDCSESLGTVTKETLAAVESTVMFTTGIL